MTDHSRCWIGPGVYSPLLAVVQPQQGFNFFLCCRHNSAACYTTNSRTEQRTDRDSHWCSGPAKCANLRTEFTTYKHGTDGSGGWNSGIGGFAEERSPRSLSLYRVPLLLQVCQGHASRIEIARVLRLLVLLGLSLLCDLVPLLLHLIQRHTSWVKVIRRRRGRGVLCEISTRRLHLLQCHASRVKVLIAHLVTLLLRWP